MVEGDLAQPGRPQPFSLTYALLFPLANHRNKGTSRAFKLPTSSRSSPSNGLISTSSPTHNTKNITPETPSKIRLSGCQTMPGNAAIVKPNNNFNVKPSGYLRGSIRHKIASINPPVITCA